MKLAKINLYHLSLPLKFSFASAKSKLNHREVLILEIIDAEQNMGYGEWVAFGTPFYTSETLLNSWDVLTKDYLPRLFNLNFHQNKSKNFLKHPFEIHKIFPNNFPMALACLENALLNLYYFRQNKNTVQSIFPEEFKPQAELGIVLSEQATNKELTEKIEWYAKQGCKRFKLKISPKSDFGCLKEIVKHYSNLPENPLKFLLDANASFDLSELYLLKEFDELSLLCIEEPFYFKNINDCKNLSAKLETPICLDESIQTLEQLQIVHQLNAIKVLNVKISKFGGLYYTKQIIDFCRENKIDFWIGSMLETSISKTLHVQLSCLKDAYMAGDLSDSVRYFEDKFTDPEIAFTNGFMNYPKGAGLGSEVIQSSVFKNCINKWEIS